MGTREDFWSISIVKDPPLTSASLEVGEPAHTAFIVKTREEAEVTGQSTIPSFSGLPLPGQSVL